MKSSTLVRLLVLAISLCAAAAAAAAAGGGQSLLSRATDLGPVDAASSIEITVWMKLHDQQGLDSLVAAQQAGKGAYLSMEQVRAQHAPSSAEVAKVVAFLKAQGFTVSAGQDNLYVKASATVARVQSAFQVELHQYNLRGRTFRASERSATLPPELVPLVSGVGGLSSLGAEPQIARAGKRGRNGYHSPDRRRGSRPSADPARRAVERYLLLGAVLLSAHHGKLLGWRRQRHLSGQPLRRLRSPTGRRTRLPAATSRAIFRRPTT